MSRIQSPLVNLLFICLLSLCDSAVSATTPSTGPGAEIERITIAELDWNGAKAIQYVLKQILEQRLGVEVEFVPSKPANLLTALDQGHIDVFPDLWMPDQEEGWAQYVTKGSRESVLVNQTPYEGAQGFYVPNYLERVRRAQDLNNPEVAALFDSDGDGKGEYWAGPPEWTSTRVQQVKARSYGFAPHFESIVMDFEDYQQELIAALEAKKPVLFYHWKPAWIHARFFLRQLEEPAFDGYAMASKKGDPDWNPDGCWTMIQPDEDENWLEKSRITCGHPENEVHIAYRRALVERVPAAVRFLSRVQLTAEMISGWILLMVEYGLDPSDMAAKWVEMNPEIVDGWLVGTD